jgi:hypothetical protein
MLPSCTVDSILDAKQAAGKACLYRMIFID